MTVLKRILGEGFRVFFLGAGLYGLFTGVVWAYWLMGQQMMWESLPRLVNPQGWHAHEMIFGYAGAAAGGFFLTAVPNWTNTPAARPVFLSVAAGLWVAGRLALWFSGMMPAVWVAVIDLSFVPILGLKIASQLIKRPKPQNMMFLLILSLFWLGNLFVHLEWMGSSFGSAATGLRVGVFALCTMIVVLGGRITPAFTRNAMKRAGLAEAAWPVSSPALDRVAFGLGLALPVCLLLGMTDIVCATIAILLGGAQFGRLARWRGGWAVRQPILFALHLSLAVLAFGLILWGLAGFGVGQELAALHVIGIGGVGGMTVAVMSRAALGHSGRDLIAPRGLVWCYGLIAGIALARWLVAIVGPSGYFGVMAVLSVLWGLVFVLFLTGLWRALVLPRV